MRRGRPSYGRKRIASDITEMRFGRLVALSQVQWGCPSGKWRFLCDCGVLKDIRRYCVTSGAVKSCGCAAHEPKPRKYGPDTTRDIPTYRSWATMIQRCENPRNGKYHRYGGRGIAVSPAWRESYEAFLRDMGHRPSRLHSIDRIDNDGNYEPGNCRWATPREQSQNKSSVKLRVNDVAQIKALLLAGHPRPALMERFHVSRATIASIAVGGTWGYVEPAKEVA